MDMIQVLNFLRAALPWIVIGVCLAVLFASMGKNAAKRKSGEEYEETYMTEGMLYTMFKYGGVSGIIAAISYIAHDAAGSVLYPWYSPIREAVSVLTAEDSPVLQVTRPLTFVYGIFSVLCCALFLVYALKQEKELLKVGAILYLAMNVISFVGYSLFPLSGGNDFMHGFVTGLVVALSVISLILFMITGIRCPKFKTLGIAATAAFAFMLAGAILTNIAPESVFGLCERFSTYAAVCFTAYLGCWLRKMAY